MARSNDIFLQKAREIGDHLLATAQAGTHGVTWKTPPDPYSPNRILSKTDIYEGNSGVALFLLELYRHTRQPKYLQIAKSALAYAHQRHMADNENNYAFITGAIGLSFAFLKMYELTGQASALQTALELARPSRNFIASPKEYLNGSAGTLLGLLHLHAVSQEPWVLKIANSYVEAILASAQYATVGACWDRHVSNSRPLCGFSHGAAGIGFVFLELGSYLKNPAYYQVADQAFAYENAYFDTVAKNWPDFRIDIWKESQLKMLEAAFKADDLSPFSTHTSMSAWCHGAPGIGLSRARAYQLTGKQTYLRDLQRALSKTKHTDSLYSTCLCHGISGNMDTFIESSLLLDSPRHLATARAAGRKLAESFQPGDQPWLFTGNAGVGYFFLRLYSPHITPSILAPRLPGHIVQPPDKTLSFLNLKRVDIHAHLQPQPTSPIESLTQTMTIHYPNSTLLFIKERVCNQRRTALMRLTDEELLNTALQLDTSCVLRQLPPDRGILLRYRPTKIDQQVVSLFCCVVLAAFAQPQRVCKAIEAIRGTYNIDEPEKIQTMKTQALKQIRQALTSTILHSPTTGVPLANKPRVDDKQHAHA